MKKRKAFLTTKLNQFVRTVSLLAPLHESLIIKLSYRFEIKPKKLKKLIIKFGGKVIPND